MLPLLRLPFSPVSGLHSPRVPPSASLCSRGPGAFVLQKSWHRQRIYFAKGPRPSCAQGIQLWREQTIHNPRFNRPRSDPESRVIE
jgi:hypothetical protein